MIHIGHTLVWVNAVESVLSFFAKLPLFLGIWLCDTTMLCRGTPTRCE